MIGAGLLATVFGGCGKVKNQVVQLKPAEELTRVVSFDFSYSSGSYMNSGNSFSAEQLEDGTVEVRIRRDTQNEPKSFVADYEFMDKLTAIFNKYEVSRWDGFRGNDKDVLDGDGFQFYLKTDSNQAVNCSGYMQWPQNYRDMKAEVEPLFIEIYESVYPDKGKILQTYLDKEIISKYGLASEEEFFLPYIAAEGPNGEQTYFERTTYDGQGGVIGYLITGFGDFGNYEEDQMLVYYFTKEDDYWRLWFEMYHVQPDYSVKKVAEQMIDSNVLFNDGIYSYIFRYYNSEGDVCLGYSGCQKSINGEGSEAYFLEAYKLMPEGIEVYGDVMLEGSTDRDEWTTEFISKMQELADRAGLRKETSDWKERPWDPMVDTLGKDVEVLTSTNFNSKFNETRKGLNVGDKIGDFGVKGSVKGCKYGK